MEYGEEICQFSQNKSFEVGFLKNKAVVAVLVESAQISCQSSEIDQIKVRKNLNNLKLKKNG